MEDLRAAPLRFYDTLYASTTIVTTGDMGSLGSYFLDVVYSFTNCMVCFPGSPQLKINSRSFKILRLLGEVSLLLPILSNKS